MPKKSLAIAARKLPPLSVKMSDELHQSVKDLAKASDMPVSEYMRELAQFGVDQRITFTRKAVPNIGKDAPKS